MEGEQNVSYDSVEVGEVEKEVGDEGEEVAFHAGEEDILEEEVEGEEHLEENVQEFVHEEGDPSEQQEEVINEEHDVIGEEVLEEEGEEVETYEDGGVHDSSAEVREEGFENVSFNEEATNDAGNEVTEDAAFEEQAEEKLKEMNDAEFDQVPTSTNDMYVDQVDAEDVAEDVVAEVGADENEYEAAVEVEEGMQEDEVDENVAEHVSDSDEDQEDTASDGVKLSHVSDDDERGSDFEESNSQVKATQDESVNQAQIAKMFDSDSDDDAAENEGDLINDIFGKSDDEDEEFTGFGVEEVKKKDERSKSAVGAISSDSDDDSEPTPAGEASKQQTPEGTEGDYDSDEGVKDVRKEGGIVYDFDLMLERKKNERKGRRKKDGGTFISDADDIINAMLTKMREAAEADREANKHRKPALNKLKMLPTVIRHLKKQDLKESFVDMGMIAAVDDWLSLLPDRSLPHLSIRTELLKILHELPGVSSETLKTSGIGKSVMRLFKHPRETRKNRESAGRLINKWSRPIFGLNDNFKSMSRGDREQRDLEHMPQAKRRRLSAGQNERREGEEEGAGEAEQLRPGERGFVMRARVPAPSHKDYVIRPKWKVDLMEDEDSQRFHRRSKGKQGKKDDRLEKHLKSFADRRKHSKMQRAVGISIEGSKMPLT
uniref:Protein IWS1 homolog n=2 Tax=Ciona intestinalis TaxID=7719 RepID=F6ZT62_CIOIN